MTQKELLYAMDAVNHLKHLTDMCNAYKCENVSDDAKNFFCTLLNEATDAYKTLTNMVYTGGKN